MHAHGCRCCPGEIIVECAALDPKNISASRASESLESSPNSRFSKEIMWFFSGGAGFEHSRAGSSAGRCVVSCRAKNRRLIRSCRRRSRTLRRGSIAAQERSGNYGFPDLHRLDLWHRDTHPIQLPIDVVRLQRPCFPGCVTLLGKPMRET